jgi:hypothetical protein
MESHLINNKVEVVEDPSGVGLGLYVNGVCVEKYSDLTWEHLLKTSGVEGPGRETGNEQPDTDN